MEAKVIIGSGETAKYIPHATELRGYEGLRTVEGSRVFLCLEDDARMSGGEVDRAEIWEETDRIYIRLVEINKEIKEVKEKLISRKSETDAKINLKFRPDDGASFEIWFMDVHFLNTLSGSNCMELYVQKNNFWVDYENHYYSGSQLLKMDLLGILRDVRENGCPSLNYMIQIEQKGRNMVSCTGEAPLRYKQNYQNIDTGKDVLVQKLRKKVEGSQEEKIFSAACSVMHICRGADHPYEELQALDGMAEIKENVNTLAKKLRYQRNRRARGIYKNTVSSMHMCFMGNPGTGKTTLARVMVGILYEMGMIERNEFIEIAAPDLKAEWANQTAKRTDYILQCSYGRVLFVDEAYALASQDKNDYGKEAISEMLKQMEDHRDGLIIIFAGYRSDMEKFLDMNIGFKSRINRYYYFRNYSAYECTEMVIRRMERSYTFTKGAIIDIYIYFRDKVTSRDFGNVRTVENVVSAIVDNQAVRVMGQNLSGTAQRNIVDERDIPKY